MRFQMDILQDLSSFRMSSADALKSLVLRPVFPVRIRIDTGHSVHAFVIRLAHCIPAYPDRRPEIYGEGPI
jgi:hypothetical protein